MEKQSLRDRLYKYLLRQHGFVASGNLQRLVMENTTQTPRTCVRRLQEMCEEGILERKLVKGHSYYRAKQPQNTAYLPPGATLSQSMISAAQNLKNAAQRVSLFIEGKSSEEVLSV